MGVARRTLLAGAAASLAAPRIARAAGASTLRFVPQADLSGMDPTITTRQVVRNAGFLVWDMLYGIDAHFEPQPQMCEGHEISSDGKTWSFRLRTGLKFHDGEPVRARDAVASIKRWMARDVMAARLKACLDAIETVDDRNFRLRLNRPFPKLLYAFGKSTSIVLFVMPERIASVDPYKSITEYVGSGPMRFMAKEWVVGASAAFERFADYQPRPEPSIWLAGGKRILMDRIEWTTMPDPATASAALQSGEIDWWETPIADLAPMLKRTKGVQIDIADPLGNVGVCRPNSLIAPTNQKLLRQAMQLVIDQGDVMRAMMGDDETLWKRMPSVFTPGTPYYTEQGSERLMGKRRPDEAKRLLEAAGYNGEKIAMPVAADVSTVKVQGDVIAEALKSAGMNVDYQAVDWGMQSTRTANKSPLDKGGWSIYLTWIAGAECANPAGHKMVDCSGATATFGWPDSPEVQKSLADWFDATNAADEKAAATRTNVAAMDYVPFIPTGFFLGYTAWRSGVHGIVKSPFPSFWGVTKT
jgi:peptide/nickel transport system substrate-binding protein